jgi:hypothetical protein
MEELKLISVFTRCVNRLAVAIRTIEDGLVPKPVFIDVSGQKQFRYEKHTVYHVAFLKGVRVVSGLNACLFLLTGGFVQEAMVLMRTIDDFLNEMLFILENTESGTLNDHQNKFIEDFFQEEFNNPNNPLLNEARRETVPKKKIWASVARHMGPYVNPSDLQKMLQVTNDALSGYVHGAYPHIMELYGGNRPKFHVAGTKAECRIRMCIDQIQIYTQRAITTFEGLAKSLGSKELFEYLHKTRDYFEKETGYVPPADMKKHVQSLKKKQ